MKNLTNRLAKIALSFVTIAGLSLAANAQFTTTWTGAAGDKEWTNGLNWDDGNEPDNATGTNNAIIPTSFTVNYDQPMLAAGFGILTNSGILNLSTNGFNCSAASLVVPGGGDRMFVNNGGVVTMTGSLIISSNASVTVAAGASLTVATLQLGNANSAGATAFFTNSGGTVTATTTTVNNSDASASSACYIISGTNNLGNVTVKRAGPSSQQALGADGLIISNGIVTMTSLNVGGNANSFTTMFMHGGLVTNTGTFLIQESTSGRNARFIQNGGIFVNAEPNTINPDPPASGDISIVSVTGVSTNITGGLQFGSSGGTAGTVNFTNTATVYVGAEGITYNGVATLNCILNNGGLFGATADWAGSANMTMSGGTFTIQAADMTGTAHNITLNNPLAGGGTLNKTGGGALTLNAANTYSGNTLINSGSLILGASGSLASPLIIVGSGTIFDVSALAGAYGPAGNQTLSGSGTVNGLVTAASGTIDPGSNALSGTLTFGSGLTEQGSVVNHFDLSSNPSGPSNDFINVVGDFTVSGANTILINGAVAANSVYPLIQYSGNFNGSLSSFTISGASGSLSNNATTQTIYFISQNAVRGPTNVVWVGNAINNNWDTELTTNWNNNGTLDFFVTGDSARFDNTGGGNTNVNIVGSVAPGSLTVDSSSNYFFSGAGSIDGTGVLIKTNSGTLTISTTNTYSGGTIINGGVLAIDTIANGGNACALGAASSDPSSVVLNGGTLAYTGASAGTDHGITLTNTGGAIDVIGGSTLTLNGVLAGPGTLTAVDSGTLILAGTGNTYTGGTTIASGTLQLNNGTAASTGGINFSNGTLVYYPSGGITIANPFNFTTGTTNMLVVTSGSSANPISGGAWSGGGVIMVSNTFSPYTVNGNLDGVTGTIQLITQGGNSFRFNSGGGNTCFGSTNATFDLGTTATLLSRNPGTMNLGALTGSSGTFVEGPSSTPGTVVWSIGNNNQNTTFSGIIQNNAGNEFSAVTKVGTGTLTLTGSSPYTGSTIISNGVLALGNIGAGDGAITSSTNIFINSGAILDVSGRSDDTMPLNSGQVICGNGTVNGILDNTAGGTVSAGDGINGSIGTLTVTNYINLGGTAWMKLNRTGAQNSDRLVAPTNNLEGNTLVVTNTGPQLHAGDTFTLFSGTLTGTFGNVILPNYYNWDTSQLTVNGTVSVIAFNPPALSADFSALISSGTITFNVTNGVPNGPVQVLSSTNVALPLTNWTAVATGNFDGSGNFSAPVTVDTTVPKQFFTISAQ